MYAIRGATTVKQNTEEDIRSAVVDMMKEIMAKNMLTSEEIISVIFSSTTDVTALYPARAFRELGYDDIPLFSCTEPPVKNSLDLCIRVLLHIDRKSENSGSTKHIYKNKAAELRPDLLEAESN